MKLIKFLTILLFFGVLLFGFQQKALALNPYKKLCVGIDGTFTADKNWKGGSIEIGCSGDNGGQVNQDPARWCKGEVQTVKPGQRFRLTSCSCFGSDKGCLKVGKNLTLLPADSKGNRYISVVKTIQETDAFKNNSCSIKLNGIAITGGGSNKVCGSNGEHITGNIKLSCKAPNATATPTPTGQSCPVPGKVQNVRVSCPNCTNNNSSLPPVLLPTNGPSQAPGSPTPTIISGGTGDIDEGNGCIRRAPLAEVVGSAQKTGDLGQAVQYEVKVTNRDASACTSRSFTFKTDFDNNTSNKWFVSWNTTGGGYQLEPGASSTGAIVQIQSLTGLTSGESLTAIVNAWYGGNDSASTSNPVTLKYTVN